MPGFGQNLTYGNNYAHNGYDRGGYAYFGGLPLLNQGLGNRGQYAGYGGAGRGGGRYSDGARANPNRQGPARNGNPLLAPQGRAGNARNRQNGADAQKRPAGGPGSHGQPAGVGGVSGQTATPTVAYGGMVNGQTAQAAGIPGHRGMNGPMARQAGDMFGQTAGMHGQPAGADGASGQTVLAAASGGIYGQTAQAAGVPGHRGMNGPMARQAGDLPGQTAGIHGQPTWADGVSGQTATPTADSGDMVNGQTALAAAYGGMVSGQSLPQTAKPLPDGVYYEPLDDSTRMFLQKILGAAGSPADPSGNPGGAGHAGANQAVAGRGEPIRASVNRTGASQAGANRAGAGRDEPIQASVNRTGASQAGANRAGAGRGEPGRDGANQAGESQAGANQAGPGRDEPILASANQAVTGRAGAGRSGPGRASAVRDWANRAGAGRGEPIQASANRPGASQAGANWAGAGRDEPERAGANQAGASQAGANQAGAGRSEPIQASANRPGAGQAGPEDANAADDFERRLGLMIQNERNAAVYYGQLAAKTARDDHRRYLERICGENLRRQALFQEIFKGRKGSGCAVAETDIYRAARFGDGLRFALNEEAGLLDDLSWLFENSADDKIRWALQGQFNRRISQINMMNAMAAEIGFGQ